MNAFPSMMGFTKPKIMIRHFIKLGFRNLKKNKSNTIISVFSLSLGIAIFFVISVFADQELKVDAFHKHSSRIFKVTYGQTSVTPGPLSELLKNNFPEIQSATHIETRQLSALSPILSYNNDPIDIMAYYSVDSAFFSIFDFKVRRGDIKSALNTPFSMILTQSEALRIFKDKDPIGQAVIWRSTQDFTFTVLAIVEDIPQNSSIQFNGLITEASTKIMTPYYPDNWGFGVYETYLLLKPNIDSEALGNKLKSFLIKYYESNLSTRACSEDARTTPLSLRPIKEVYFNSKLNYDTTNRGSLFLIRILVAISMIILLLSIVAYVNLTTAKASLRNKEIGIQKVFGSGRKSLILQYLTETSIISIFAAIIGVAIAVLMLPRFSQFMNLSQSLQISTSFFILLVPGVLVLGLIAGIYPALYLSSQKEISMLKIGKGNSPRGKSLRNLLVIFQFFISITLIAFTLLIDKQVTFLKEKDLGIEKEYVVYARLPMQILRGKKGVFTERVLSLPGIQKVAYSSGILGMSDGFNYDNLDVDGKTLNFASIWVDAEFINLYELKLLEGRFFSEELRADINATALLNEAAVREFDMDDPFELEIRVPGGKARVVGIVQDFNYKSLHHEIEPLAIVYLPRQGAYANIKITGNNLQQTLDAVDEIWTELAPGYPFSYQFLDSSFEKLYKSEGQMGKAISFSSIIAIIIAILGVLSLSLFICESRMKEIAIRKINGAKVWEVILGLNKTFAFNLTMAFILACPAGWFVMHKWLDNFAYKTKISPWIFLSSGLLLAMITFIIVSWQSWRSANRNPAETLRSE